MLWFKFIHGLMFSELVSILFAIVTDYGNEYMTKENKNWTSFKNFAPKLNLTTTYTNQKVLKVTSKIGNLMPAHSKIRYNSLWIFSNFKEKIA